MLPSEHHSGYDPNCPGCQVALLDYRTGRPLPEDHPLVQSAQRILEQAPKPEQDAYINVCVNNSRDPNQMELAQRVVRRIQVAMLLSNRT